MELRFCDDFGADGFSWIVDESVTRTSHALASAGKVWLVDPVDWPDAIERARSLGKPTAVLQLLDRHNRDCATIASRLGIPHVVVPDDLPGTPFECVTVKRSKRWKESTLWWLETRTLVVAEALGTNAFYTGGKGRVGVHLVLRLTPPTMLASYEPERLLVGHGEGVDGPAAKTGLEKALADSRRGLPRLLLRLPFAGRS